MKKHGIVLSFLIGLFFMFLFNLQAVYAYTEVTDLKGEYNDFAYPNSAYKKGITPPFSQNQAQQDESITPITGDLCIKQTDLFLKGKNGLDFTLTRFYDLSNASINEPYVQSIGSYYIPGHYYVYAWVGGNQPFLNDYATASDAWQFYNNWLNVNNYNPGVYYGAQAPFTVSSVVAYKYDYSNQINTTSSKQKYSDLGEGWAFDLPYIKICNDYKYLNYGSSGTWQIDFSSSASSSHLKDYILNDMILSQDSQSYSNGEKSSYYVLTQKDGKKTYFGEDGRLLGIKDKYGNEIKFKHDTSTTGSPIINYITDSANREINISYTSDNVTITVNDPTDSSNNRTVVYNKTKSQQDSNKYELSSVVDANNRTTSYEYTYLDAKVNQVANDINSGVTNYYACLSKIKYPTGAETDYHYQKSTKNCGNDGVMEFYKVSDRFDIQQDGVSYNYQKYNYKYNSTGEYDGYPTYKSDALIPDSYAVQTQIVDNDGNTELYTYNKKLLCTDLLKEGTSNKSETINEYDSTTKLLTKITQKIFNKATGSVMSKIQNFLYDSANYRDLINYWDTQSEGNTGDTEHKTTYTYDSTYHYVTSKSYKKDATTTIVEEYTPYTDDSRKIEWYRLKENGVLKKQTQYIYDSYGNVIEERRYKDNLSDYVPIKYDYNDNVTSRNGKFNGLYLTRKWIEGIKDADGNLITSRSGLSSGSVDESSTYDWFGNVISKTDGNGQAVTYIYDKLNRVTEQINPDSSYKIYVYQTDATNNYVIIKDENYNSSEYNSYGNETKYLFDKLGNMIAEQIGSKNSDGTYGLVTRNQYTYDDRMKLKNEHNLINGGNINYQYTSDGRIQQVEVLDSGTNLVYRENYTYEDSDSTGLYSIVTKTVKGEDNAPDIVTKSYIDKLGKVEKQVNPHLGVNYTNTFKYDYLGNKIEEKSARAADEGWSNEYTAKYKYNYAGKLVDTETTEGNHTSSTYDSLGNLVTTTDFKNKVSAFEYDNLGRLIKQTTPFDASGNSVKKNYYDGSSNITKVLTSRNIPGNTEDWDRTDYEYNNRNKLTKVTTYTDINTPENYTQYYYDYVGNKLRMYNGLAAPLTINGLDNVTAGTDTEYSITKYGYNQLGNLISKIDPSLIEESYTYDLNGTLQNEKDKNSSILTYSYDVLKRMTGKNVVTSDGTGNESYSYGYYLNGNRKSMSGGGIDTTYIYDDLGRATNVTDSDGITRNYTYDANNNRTSFVINQNGTNISNTTYFYDHMNRLQNVYENGQLIATYTYDTNGNRNTLTYGNGVSVNYDYNYSNMLNTITNKNSAGSVISQYSYDYYLDGNQATKTDTDGTTMYKYDGLGRINTVEGPNSLFKKYGYDDKNNRTDLTATGEVFSDPEDSTFSYDGFNQLKSAAGNHNSTYTYNADGIRNTKAVDGVGTTQVLDGGNVAAEITGGTVTKYVRGVNLIYQEKNGQKYYYLYNGHGDVVQIVDSTGNVVNNYDYDEWGNIKNQNEGVENPFKYSGEYFDKETGLYYLRARYYDSTLGRFINEDGYWSNDKDPLSLNLYTYCSNNPINFFDPTGHIKEGDDQYSITVQKLLNGDNMDGNGGLSKLWKDNANNPDVQAQIEATADKIRDFDKGGRINKVVLLNSTDNKTIVVTHGHMGILIVNESGQSIFSSYYPVVGSPDCYGETRVTALDADGTSNLLKTGTITNAIASDGDLQSEQYERGAAFGVEGDNGQAMFNEAVYYFNNPGWYSYPGHTCDNVAHDILKAGGIDYIVKNTPNGTFEYVSKLYNTINYYFRN